jgi:predicted MFS family arabinose efflux permease
VAACVAVAALVALFMADRPEDLGLGAYGEDAPRAGAAAAPAASGPGPVRRALLTLREAAGVPAFWALFATFFICGLSTNGLIQSHFIPFCFDHGLGETDAASVLAMMGIFDFVGTVASGWLSDRVDNRWLLFWYYGLRGLSLLWLPHSTFTLYGLSVFAMFYGLDWIATVPPTVRLAAKSFGRERGPLVFGWVFTGHQLGAAVATSGAGAVRTGLGDYLPAFYAAGAMCLVGALVALAAGGRRHRDGVAIAASPAA